VFVEPPTRQPPADPRSSRRTAPSAAAQSSTSRPRVGDLVLKYPPWPSAALPCGPDPVPTAGSRGCAVQARGVRPEDLCGELGRRWRCRSGPGAGSARRRDRRPGSAL